MKRLITLTIIFGAIVPQIALAAWWNPFSWKIFERIFAPKSDVMQIERQNIPKPEIMETTVSEYSSEVATTTEQEIEIQKLKEEIEKLKENRINQNNTNQTPKTPVTKGSATPLIPKPTPQTITTQPVNKDVLFADIHKKYNDFWTSLTTEQKGLSKDSSLPSERQHYIFINDLFTKVNADLGYLNNIKDWNPRPMGIEEIYLSKFIKLKSEYDIKANQYIFEIKQDLIDAAATAAKEREQEATNAILKKENYIKEIKVKIAEMDQLRTQIDTLAGSSLIDILNIAKKLDGNNLFYSFTYEASGSYQFHYPYDRNSCAYGCSSQIKSKLQAIVSNYKAFLVVELAKNE